MGEIPVLTLTDECIEDEVTGNQIFNSYAYIPDLTTEGLAPGIVYRIIRDLIAEELATKNPRDIHYRLAQEVVGKGKKEEKDVLARGLCEEFKILLSRIPAIDSIEKFTKTPAIPTQPLPTDFKWTGPPSGFDMRVTDEKSNKDCFNRKEFVPSSVLLDRIKKCGKEGKQREKKRRAELEAKSKDLFAPTFWFVPYPCGPFRYANILNSSALMSFTRSIWEYSFKGRFEFDQKYPTSMPNLAYQEIMKLFGKKDIREDKEKGHIIINKGDDIIATAEVPLTVPGLFERAIKGIPMINSVMGHRMVRYGLSIPFEQKKAGISDWRVKKFDGGFTELARELGIKGENGVTKLRTMMLAMKYVQVTSEFPNDKITGSLLTYDTYRSAKTGREDGLGLTILRNLVPYGDVDCRRAILIPTPTEAPPIANMASQLHAPLYMLQMLLLQEFSSQSRDLFIHDSISLSLDGWKRLFKEAGLNTSYLDRVLGAWKEGEEEAPAIIEQVDRDRFTLAKPYKKQLKFIKGQGEYREKSAKEGRKSRRKKS